jgi:hypothetical protein
MKFTETIEELESQIEIMETCIKRGYDGDDHFNDDGTGWRSKLITNMACAIEVLKNNES